jgi:hypothetical protein
MAIVNSTLFNWKAAFLLASSLLITDQALGAPLIQAASGDIVHGATLTISGTAFGSKSTAAPVVWDDASGSSLGQKWDGFVPNDNANYNAAYRTPIRGIALPHTNITKYIAGAHAENRAYHAGWNVMFWKHRSFTTYPQYTYASWYQRSDDRWVFGLNNPADSNYKCFSIDEGYSEPYGGVITSNIEYNGRPTSRTATPGWHMYDGGGNRFAYPDVNGNQGWWDKAVNPMSGVWSKVEVEIKHSPDLTGYLRLWENGILKINHVGKTANSSEKVLTIAIGGYTRDSGNVNNWRYFADVYLDYTPARVVLANNANLNQATIIEPQIPSRWTDTSIDVSVNLGKFTADQTAWLFVVDGSGVRSAIGFPVTIGSSPKVPNAPTDVVAG